jgi:2-iminoacetate synthase
LSFIVAKLAEQNPSTCSLASPEITRDQINIEIEGSGGLAGLPLSFDVKPPPLQCPAALPDFDPYSALAAARTPILRRFERLLADDSPGALEGMARQSRRLTRQHFGNTMRLFAPLYLSNECINNCTYCGFSRDNTILRTTLSVGEVVREARHLHDRGLRNLLLVAGEHPKFVSDGYLQDCIDALRPFLPTLAIEVGPMEDSQYAEIVAHGAEGLVVYQETYDRETYRRLHTAGPKKDYAWRLACPQRAYAGGFRRIGIGALFGLADWRFEALSLAAHLEHLLRHCWKARFTVSFARMQPHAGNYQYKPDPRLHLPDRALVRLVCAFRICFPQVGIVLSTREPAALRDSLALIGVTDMSANVSTEPGGHTGAGASHAHITCRGRQIEAPAESARQSPTEQFRIHDSRSAAEIAAMLCRHKLEPVWKDWDQGILAHGP